MTDNRKQSEKNTYVCYLTESLAYIPETYIWYINYASVKKKKNLI